MLKSVSKRNKYRKIKLKRIKLKNKSERKINLKNEYIFRK